MDTGIPASRLFLRLGVSLVSILARSHCAIPQLKWIIGSAENADPDF